VPSSVACRMPHVNRELMFMPSAPPPPPPAHVCLPDQKGEVPIQLRGASNMKMPFHLWRSDLSSRFCPGGMIH